MFFNIRKPHVLPPHCSALRSFETSGSQSPKDTASRAVRLESEFQNYILLTTDIPRCDCLHFLTLSVKYETTVSCENHKLNKLLSLKNWILMKSNAACGAKGWRLSTGGCWRGACFVMEFADNNYRSKSIGDWCRAAFNYGFVWLLVTVLGAARATGRTETTSKHFLWCVLRHQQEHCFV